MTVEEYLELERTSAVRHEFVAGHVYVMAGGSERHNRIALALASRLLTAAAGSACRVMMSDMKVRVGESLFYYPDVVVVCDPADAEPYFKTRPCLLVEVLSSTTEVVDRREKLHNYRRLESLQAYVLVDQDQPRIETYHRTEAGGWRYDLAEGDGRVALPCPGVQMSVREIYGGLESTPPPSN
jgi:Uma2 family endonuclease